jgi:hypothetical protein
MIKMKKMITVTLLCFVGVNAQSQVYYHGLGATALIHMGSIAYTSPSINYTGNTGTYLPGITYKATLGFEAGKNAYFGVSGYPTLGFSFTTGGGGNSLGYQIPVMGEFYTSEPNEPGFIAGAGFSYGFAAADDAFGVSGGTVMGPVASLGGQFELGGKLVGIRASWTLGINKTKDLPADAVVTKDSKSMATLGVYYVFGY